MNRRTVYLDYAAATPVDSRVLKAMEPYFSQEFYNPSATYLAAQQVKKTVETARANVAGMLGAKPAEIIFTAGGTEANNLAVHGVLTAFPKGNAVVSSIEHESVLEPARKHAFHEVKVDRTGRVNLADLKQKINNSSVLVSIMQANNEIGTIQPIREIAKMIKQIRSERRALGNNTPLYLHTDACQAGNYLDLHVHRLGVDLMTLNGGKMYGPKQSGILYKAAHAQLEPIIFGGGQEFELRSGTENVASIIGFATALGMAQSAKTKEVKRLQELQEQFINGLQGLQGWALQASECVINGSLKHRLPNNVHVTFLDQDNERLMMALDERGIMAATGSACSASKEEASHVLTALGLTETEARSSLRFTMGRQTTLEDIKYTVAMLQSVATTL